MKQKLKTVLMFLLNPRLLLCVGLAWMITNGWSYVLFGLGTILGIPWMIAVGGAYMAALWFPFTPEKIVTFAIAIALLRWLFPKDEKTLAILKNGYEKAKGLVRTKRQKRREKKEKKKELLSQKQKENK